MRLFADRRAGQVLVSAIVCAIVLFAFARLRVQMPLADTVPLPSSPIAPMAPIFGGSSIVQEFPAGDRNISSVDFMFGTYARENRGTLTLDVSAFQRGGWKRLGSASVNKSSLADNSKHSFTFDPPLSVTRHQPVALTLRSDGTDANAVAVWGSTEWELPGHKLRINGALTRGATFFFVSYEGISGVAGGKRMRARLWKRITLLLDTPGQVLLVSGVAMALFGFIHLLLWRPEESTPISSDRTDFPVHLSRLIRRLLRLDTPAPTDAEARIALWAARGLMAMAAWVAVANIVRLQEFRLDDALIYARYVRNLYAGDGLVFTPGQSLNAITSPLYVWLVVLFTPLATDASAAGVLVSSLCLLLTLIVVAAHLFPHRSPLVGAAACLGLATTGLNYSTLGMESSLTILLASIALCLVRTEHWAWFGFIVGLMGLARAEMVFLAMPLFVGLWRSTGRIPWRPAVVAAATMVPALAFNAITYGSALPDTLTAKLQQGRSGFWGTDHVFLHGMREAIDLFHVGIFKTVLAAALSALCFLEKPRPYPSAVVASYMLLLVGFYSSASIPAYHWYLVPLVWGLCLLAPLGASSALRFVARRQPAAVPLCNALLGACAVYLLSANYQKVEQLAGSPHPPYLRIGTWLRDNVKPGSSLGAAEVGHLGWYSNLPIVDISGLVTAGNADLLGQGDVDGWLTRHRPDYVLVHDPILPIELGAQHALDRGELEVDARLVEPGFKLLGRPESLRVRSGSLLGTLKQSDSMVQEGMFIISGVEKRGIFMHPVSHRDFELLDRGARRFRAALGIAPNPDASARGDGATFRLLIRRPGQEAREALREHVLPGQWREVDIELGDIEWLSLRTEPGPAGSSEWDWAVWGEPEVVDVLAAP